jgi:hypothetical protein
MRDQENPVHFRPTGDNIESHLVLQLMAELLPRKRCKKPLRLSDTNGSVSNPQ